MIYEIGKGTGVYCIEGAGARVYYVARPQPMLIDTGAPGQIDMILRSLASIGVQPIYIRKIVLTHHHPGHVGNAEELKRKSGAVVFAHPSDIPFITGKLKRRDPRSPFERVWNATTWSALSDVVPVIVDRFAEQDVEINGWRVIHTPGHTPGHICLLRERILISGDLLQASSGGFREAPATTINNVLAARVSIARIADLEFDALLPGHNPPYVFGASARVRELADHFGVSTDEPEV